ncbi:MAG: hypothetical protein EP329_11050 [Deltaproteobacteria bacterium]|nr:MAG: hypothetical protein EP329_11050 [Deltaproteobacteria bacterium]
MSSFQPSTRRRPARAVALRPFAALLLTLALATPAAAGTSGDEALDAALASWDVLQRNVEVSRVKKRDVDGVTVATAKVKAFGFRADLEGRARGTDPHRLALSFTPARQLSTDVLAALVGSTPSEALPAGVGAGFGVKRIEVDFANRRPVAARVVLDGGTWAPFGGAELRLTDFLVTLTLHDPFGERSFEVYLAGAARLPKKLAKYLGLPESALNLTGYADTRAKTLLLTVALGIDELPLGPSKAVVLEGAELRLGFVNAAPTLAIGGTLGLRPAQGGPLTLKGEVALKLTGEVFAQAWTDGVWDNPLGASEQLHIERLGLGFGADFTAVPWPMPILALQGGLAVGPDPARPLFRGHVLVGVHGGDPTQNMIDASLERVNALDLVTPFVQGGMPGVLGETLRGIEVSDARLTVVPPGPGVTLFGVYYPPGFQIAGKLQAGSFRGELDVDVSPLGVEAFASVTPIAFPGFSLTGAGGAPGPYLYVVAKQGTKALALNGTLDVLGIKRSADVSVSAQGFSATLSGSLFGVVEAELEVAGRNPFKDDGGVYVSATMGSRLNQQLMDAVAGRIDEHVKQANAGFEAARADLERERQRLIAADQRLNAARDRARAELHQQCRGFQDSDRDRQAKRARQQELDTAIAGHERRIGELDRAIADAKGHATKTRSTLNPLDCAKGQVWDPIRGGGCYSCPGGMNRDTTVHIEKKGACSRSTAAWDAERVKVVAALGAARADRDVVSKALAQLERAVDRAAEAACHTVADASAIDRLPGVRDIVKEHAGINAAIDAAQLAVKGGELATRTTASTAKWLAQRGGQAAGILALRRASFSGCLNKVADGYVSMEIDGTFAGQPVSGQFDVKVQDMRDGARALADSLFANGRTPAARGNGSCVRPNVPRVTPDSVHVVDRVTALRKTRRADPKAQAKAPTRPEWAPTREQSAARDRAAAKKPDATKKDQKTPQVDAAARCRQLVQGEIPYDVAGRRAWPGPSLEALCRGTADGVQPGTCYRYLFAGRMSLDGQPWQPEEGIALCGGTSNARETLACFTQATGSGANGKAAIERCRAR